MADPTDYFSTFRGIENPLNALMQGFQSGQDRAYTLQQRDVQAQAQQAAVAQQQQLAALDAKIRANPTRELYLQRLQLDPKAHDAIKVGLDNLDENQRNSELQYGSSVHGYLKAGKADLARQQVQQRRDADKAAGRDTTDEDRLLSLIDSDPLAARDYTGMILAGATGPKDIASTITAVGNDARAQAKLPADIANTQAQTGLYGAQANKANVDAALAPAQTQAQIDLTRASADNNRSQVEQRAFEREQLLANGPPLSPSAQGAINAKVDSATSSRSLGERATGLADRIASAHGQGGGFTSSIANTLGATLGFQPSEMAQLRKEYQSVNIQQAVKNLPPGPASDKDVKLAMKGFPPDNAPASQLVDYLRAVSNIQEISAQTDDLKADWLAGNGGSLGPARRGFFVGNDFIQPGDKFTEIQKRAIAERQRSAAAAAVK